MQILHIMAFRDTKAKVKKDYLKGPQRLKGNLDKENLIHMLNMVFGVGHIYIIKDTDSMIMLDRHR